MNRVDFTVMPLGSKDFGLIAQWYSYITMMAGTHEFEMRSFPEASSIENKIRAKDNSINFWMFQIARRADLLALPLLSVAEQTELNNLPLDNNLRLSIDDYETKNAIFRTQRGKLYKSAGKLFASVITSIDSELRTVFERKIDEFALVHHRHGQLYEGIRAIVESLREGTYQISNSFALKMQSLAYKPVSTADGIQIVLSTINQNRNDSDQYTRLYQLASTITDQVCTQAFCNAVDVEGGSADGITFSIQQDIEAVTPTTTWLALYTAVKKKLDVRNIRRSILQDTGVGNKSEVRDTAPLNSFATQVAQLTQLNQALTAALANTSSGGDRTIHKDCFRWMRNSECSLGDTCKFLHSVDTKVCQVNNNSAPNSRPATPTNRPGTPRGGSGGRGNSPFKRTYAGLLK
jgi:hypothetical protein